ncbi:phosphotransferase [Kineococcus sp. R86509]|uniref:phosphotransferase n=1 Tax=Kineococcus sp. R86509 TaxID=3093851 RepID=UPI0036D3FB43
MDEPLDPVTDSLPPEGLPAEVMVDVASAVGAQVTVLSRFPGGLNAGAVRVQVAGQVDAVLKVEARAHPDHFKETLRAKRIVEHMRGVGYLTPAWLAVGATASCVWHLTEFVDAAPARELTTSLVEQLMAIIELQAGQASEPHDHSSYAWRVVTAQEPILDRLVGYSGDVTALVERSLSMCAGAPPPKAAPDMVHADFNPSNVLVRDGVVVAVVDIGNAGCGTRATDLTTLLWHTVDGSLEGVRKRLWTRILAVVGGEWAAVLTATQILLQLEWPIRLGRHALVAGVIERGNSALDELSALR